MATRSPKSAAPPPLDATMRAVILRGPDRYLRDAHTDRLVEALEAEHGDIEIFRFEGAATEPAVVLDELRSYGLLQAHKLVIVDQADAFLAAREESTARRPPRALLEAYLASPVESATLLLRADTWRPGRIDKLVACVIKCDAPTEGQAVAFCRGRIEKRHAASIENDAAHLLVERVGADLGRLDTELAKLAAFVGEGGTVSADEVRAMVGLSREEQAWSIQSALLSGEANRAVRKLRELRTISNQPEQLVTWAMTDLVRKLHTASRLLARGMPEGSVAKEVKLWGDGRRITLEAARRIGPDRLAALFDRCLDADASTKRGLGRADRTLEVLAVEIADTMTG